MINYKTPSLIISHLILLPLTFFLLLLYMHTVSNDYLQYQLIYDLIKDGTDIFGYKLLDLMSSTRYEPGFLAVYYFLSNYLSGENIYILLASITLILKYAIFNKYLEKPVKAWLIYIVLFLPYSDASQLRTAIAVTMILYVICSKTDKNFFIKTSFSMLFHYVGVITYMFKFIKKPFYCFFIIIFCAFAFDQIILFINSKIEIPLTYFISNNFYPRVNIFSSISIAQLMISFFCINKWRSFNEQQKRGAFLIIFGMIIYYIMSNNPGVAHRVREISLLGIFPLLFSSDKLKFNFSSLYFYFSIAYIIINLFCLNLVELYSFL